MIPIFSSFTISYIQQPPLLALILSDYNQSILSLTPFSIRPSDFLDTIFLFLNKFWTKETEIDASWLELW
jgi:hypothetical protein